MPHLPYNYPIVRIIDIDGTILKRQNLEDYFKDKTEVLPECVNIVNRWFENGDYILLWTARPDSYRLLTMQQLDGLGFKYHQLLMNKPHGMCMCWYDDKDIYAFKVNPEVGLVGIVQ